MARKSVILILAVLLMAPLILGLASVAITAFSLYASVNSQIPEGAEVSVVPGFNIRPSIPMPALVGIGILILLMFFCGIWLLKSNRTAHETAVS